MRLIQKDQDLAKEVQVSTLIQIRYGANMRDLRDWKHRLLRFGVPVDKRHQASFVQASGGEKEMLCKDER